MQPSPNKAPKPAKKWFDPWNSASTGHQTAQNVLSGSTSWRHSRSYKLSHQFRDQSGEGGQTHPADLVGAGSENFGKDGRKTNGGWEKGALGQRERGCQDIRESFGTAKKRSSDATNEDASERKRPRESRESQKNVYKPQNAQNASTRPKELTKSNGAQDTLISQLFLGITVYQNGSTAPLVGDHKLKQLVAQHGGNVAVALGRKTVTHVILSGSGTLAASKLQREIDKTRGQKIKFVTADW